MTLGEKQLIIRADEDQSLIKNGDCFTQVRIFIQLINSSFSMCSILSENFFFFVILARDKLALLKV